MKSLIGYIIIVFWLFNTTPTKGQEKQGLFRDSLDNAIDLSTWLLDLHGFVPVVAPITEPAVGWGNGCRIVFYPEETY